MQFRRFKFTLLLVLAACLLAAPTTLPAQTSAASQAPQRKTSTPYTGDLSIFETPGRDEQLHIQQVMDALAIAPGKTVADIGAGSGWFTVRAAKRVTATGTVYAVDINPAAIQYIEERVKKEQLHNVKTILSKPDDPELPPSSIDAVLLLKTYHEVANPVALLRNVAQFAEAGCSSRSNRPQRQWRRPRSAERGRDPRGRAGRLPFARRARRLGDVGPCRLFPGVRRPVVAIQINPSAA